MHLLVERDIGINVEWRSWEDAIEYFKNSDQPGTLLLLEHLNDAVIPLNECSGFRDLHVAPLVPSTGVLRTFTLLPYHEGFLLRYPHKEEPDRVTRVRGRPHALRDSQGDEGAFPSPRRVIGRRAQ